MVSSMAKVGHTLSAGTLWEPTPSTDTRYSVTLGLRPEMTTGGF